MKLSDSLFQFVSVEDIIESSPVARAGRGLRGLSEALLGGVFRLSDPSEADHSLLGLEGNCIAVDC